METQNKSRKNQLTEYVAKIDMLTVIVCDVKVINKSSTQAFTPCLFCILQIYCRPAVLWIEPPDGAVSTGGCTPLT